MGFSRRWLHSWPNLLPRDSSLVEDAPIPVLSCLLLLPSLAHESWPLHHDISNPPPFHLTSRKPLWHESELVDINSQWRESWKSASVVNAHLADDPTIRQPGFALPRQQWSLLNRFCTGQDHCGAFKKKWKLSDSDQCSCGETQTMSHIVESCPRTRVHGGLSKLHCRRWCHCLADQLWLLMHRTTTTTSFSLSECDFCCYYKPQTFQ